jgi:hypothetical protein
MSRYELKRLPKGFRFLLTVKEIKEMEAKGDFKFTTISTGHITEAGHFKADTYIQSSFRGVSISGYQNDSYWFFTIYQSGFRTELLPPSLENEIKSDVQQKVIEYIAKIQQSKETDGFRSPQLWGLVMIIEGKAKVKWQEHK